MVSLLKRLVLGGIGLGAILTVNGCGAPQGDGGDRRPSHLLSTHSSMFSEHYEFVQLNKDGTYTAKPFHGEAESGSWVKSTDNKQVSLTQTSSGKVEQRTLATTVDLTPFLDHPCKTAWKPGKDDGYIAYRAVTLKSDGTFNATSGVNGADINGSWSMGYTAYSKRVTSQSGAVSYIPMLGSAIEFKENGGETWSVGVTARGKRGFHLEDDATDGNTGRYPYYKIVSPASPNPDNK